MDAFRILLCLLLPGAALSILTLMKAKRGHRPRIVLLGWDMPLPVMIVFILASGWLLLGMMLGQAIRRKA